MRLHDKHTSRSIVQRLAVLLVIFCAGCASTAPKHAVVDTIAASQASQSGGVLGSLAAAKSDRATLRRLPPVAAPGLPEIQLASHWQEAVDEPSDSVFELEPPDLLSGENSHVIDLAGALALGGANSWEVSLARERFIEAQEKLREARALWLPSLRVGAGYTRHDGQIQDTSGPVFQGGRNSLFVGGGAGLGDAPILGGAGGPPRLFVNLSLSDAYFKPLAARRRLQAAGAESFATRNNSLLEIAERYYDFLEAEGKLANAQEGLKAIREMRELVEIFAREGGGSLAEVDRATTEETRWRIAVEDSRRRSRAASVELIRLLRLDTSMQLLPAEAGVAPVTLIEQSRSLEELIAQALATRPELTQRQALISEAFERYRMEQWRPWLPNLQAAGSGGAFGGGPSGQFDNQKGRGDVELIAVWELRNLGVGNQAKKGQRSSQLRQRQTELSLWRDRVVTDVAAAMADAESFQTQIDIAVAGAESAAASYRRNLQRIREGEGSPLELLHAIRARGETQDAHTHAVVQFNRAQARLLRAIGQIPEAPSS